MLAYILRRVFQSLIVLLAVGLVAFAMFNFVGDPVDNMLGQERTQDDIERLRQQLGLDQSFVVQYWKFLEQAAQGNFGLSYRQGRPRKRIKGTCAAGDHAGPVSNDADHAFGAHRNARGAAHGLYPLCPRPRYSGKIGELSTCLEKYIGARDYHYWPAIGQHYRLCHYHGNCVSVARRRIAVYQRGSVRRYPSDGRVFDDDFRNVRRNQPDC